MKLYAGGREDKMERKRAQDVRKRRVSTSSVEKEKR